MCMLRGHRLRYLWSRAEGPRAVKRQLWSTKKVAHSARRSYTPGLALVGSRRAVGGRAHAGLRVQSGFFRRAGEHHAP
jgi:hypothetical protein